MPYSYYKALPLQETPAQKFRKDFKKKAIRSIPNLLLIIGATAVTTVIYPMFSYQFTSNRWAKQAEIAVVEPQDFSAPQDQASQGPIILDDIDYTKASNWFPSVKPKRTVKQKDTLITSYTLSIPKLKIDSMNVVIGGEDLDEHLIHYPGTALPGELGNPVVFGHSVLPVFYNPKNYISVFSTLPSLEEGDEILINFDGITYKYVVNSYHEVLPTQVEVLEQRYDRKTLTLITCVPPGTYLRRGVILAELVEY